MLSPRVRCLLLVAATICLAAAASRETKARQLILRNPDDKQDILRYSLHELLSELVQENEVLEEDAAARAREDDVHEQLERASGPLAPRERKAGCKNFFWKTFTSC